MLHPAQMAKITAPDLKIRMKEISKFYELEGIESEAELCRFFWTKKKENLETLELTDAIQHAETFYPKVNTAPHILLAMPYSTVTIERTFSTLRRVKTWLRSTMSEERLNGLCMLSPVPGSFDLGLLLQRINLYGWGAIFFFFIL